MPSRAPQRLPLRAPFRGPIKGLSWSRNPKTGVLVVESVGARRMENRDAHSPVCKDVRMPHLCLKPETRLGFWSSVLGLRDSDYWTFVVIIVTLLPSCSSSCDCQNMQLWISRSGGVGGSQNHALPLYLLVWARNIYRKRQIGYTWKTRNPTPDTPLSGYAEKSRAGQGLSVRMRQPL